MRERGQPTLPALADEPDAHPDDAMVAAALQDRQAFAALYERYAGRVYRYARVRSGSDAVAEDVLSETMLQAMQGLGRFDPERGSFAGWLFTIAARRITDRHRRRRSFRHVFARLSAPHNVHTQDDALANLLLHDQASRLHAALRDLRDVDRDLLLLRYGADLTGAEIGQMLGMSAGAVRVRIMRLLKHLAIEIGDAA